jgi:lipopolysaccharide exporter
MQALKRDNSFMGYTKHAVSGFSWQIILKGVIAVVTLGKIFFLARLLDPNAFGLFSLISIALGVSEATTQTGVNVTIIQSKRSMQYFVDTAWVIAIIRGLLIGSLMTLLGLGMSRFYQQPELFLLIGLASLVPVIKGFINPSIVLMQKELNFFADSGYRFTLVVIESILAVLLALALKSVLALVLALIGAALLEVVISFLFFSVKPQFHYVRSSGALIFKNAKWLSFSTLLIYLHENLDNVMVGKLTSTYALGVYHNAYGLGHKANYDVARAANHSTFPIFAKLADQPNRSLRAFMKSTAVMTGIMFLGSLPLILLPGFFVTLILGDQWQEAIPIVRWLAMAGFLQGLSSLFHNFLIANKSYLAMNIHLALTVFLMVILLLTLAPSSGLLGVGVAIFVSRLVTLPIIIFAFLHKLGFTEKIKKLWT